MYGPAAAVVATLSRLGWVILSATCMCNDLGVSVNLRESSPAYVKGVVTESVVRWRWRRVEKKFPSLSSQKKGLALVLLGGP